MDKNKTVITSTGIVVGFGDKGIKRAVLIGDRNSKIEYVVKLDKNESVKLKK